MNKKKSPRLGGGLARRLLSRAVSLLLTFALAISTNAMTAFAVTGSTVAADGTYSGYSSEGTVTVKVSNGKIANVSANVKSKYQNYITSAFSSVIGKAATTNNIDAVSAPTKHMGAIKSGAKSALQSAPSADGSDDGGSSGSGSGSGSGTTSQNEFTIEVKGKQELSVTSDELWSYSWESSEPSKASVSGTGASATVTGEAVTSTPVTITCTYGSSLLGQYGMMTKEYKFTVVSGENEDIQNGVGEKTGTKYTGKAYVNDDEEDEWVELDVYVDQGKIAGIYIAAEDGSWLNLLTTVQSNFIGLDATAAAVDAVSSATTKGFRDTIRKAISNALGGEVGGTTKVPVITSGNGGAYTKESNESLTFVSDADFSTFEGVTIDGTTIESSNYEAKSGSTEVTLKSNYLETLGTGSHSIGIVSSTGTASAAFTVAAAEGGGQSISPVGGSSNGPFTGTIVSELSNGDYIIAGRYSSRYSYYALGNSIAGTYGYGYAGVDVTIDGNTATVADKAAIWTWDSSKKSFYNAAVEKYLNLPSDLYSQNGFFSSSPVALTFYTISGNEATLYVPSGNGGYCLAPAYPSGGKAFTSSNEQYINSSYIKSGDGVYFYKIDSTQEQKAEIALSKTATSLELGGTDTVTATLTGCNNLSYTSSNSNVADVSISGNSISVTGKVAGTTVLTFSAAATGSFTTPDTVTLAVTVNSGGTGGGGTGQTTTTTPGDPKYVKSITPDGEAADEYTIALNVTADDLESTTSTPGTPGQGGTNLVMLIDISGSISGKETVLNRAIQAVNDGVSAGSQVGVVTFNEGVQESKIYAKGEDIDRFQAVEYAGTYMDRGITGAVNLLNGNGWNNPSNKKAMVIISDFQIDNSWTSYMKDTINNAKSAKDDGITIYSVKFDSADVNVANRVDLRNPGSFTEDAHEVARYVSSQYPGATAADYEGNNPWLAHDEIITVTPGQENTDATFVFGLGGGDWSSIFQEIQGTQGMTETSTEPMKNVVITDTLSPYVELVNKTSPYEVTLETDDSNVTLGTVTVTEDTNGNTVVGAPLNGTLTDGATYTVKIPVKPSDLAHKETDQSTVATQTFYSNGSAVLSYEYDDDNKGEVAYAEKPQIVVARQVKLTYDSNVDEGETVSGMPDPLEATATVAVSGADVNKAGFTISNATPTREGYTFLGWNTDKGAASADTDLESGKQVKLEANTTLYAIWQQNTRTYTLKYDKNAGEDTVNGVPTDDTYVGPEDSHTFNVSGDTPTREGYTFLGWAMTKDATTADVNKTVSISSTDENLTKTVYAVWRQDYRIIFEDYTNGGAEIGGITTEEIADHDNCKISTTYVNGDVTFTLSADKAVVALAHQAAGGMNYDNLMSETDNYKRLYCKDAETKHQFTVSITSSDVYIVLAYKGDVNLDGSVNLKDSTCANKIYVDTYNNKTALRSIIGDVDNNESINLKDSTYINKSYVGTYTLTWDLADNT